MLILNKHASFDKGVSKVLKMTTMALIEKLHGDNDEIVNFMITRFPLGSLTFRNTLSYLKFLASMNNP